MSSPSSNTANSDYDPVANLNMQPAKSILKSTKSIDEARRGSIDESESTPRTSEPQCNNINTASGMTRSESKSHKIPHFDEMNILATYHPVDKDYGHMKIEEPKTPFAPANELEEDMDMEHHAAEASSTGVDPNALAKRLNESSIPSPTSSRSHIRRSSGTSADSDNMDPSSATDEDHRRQFESQRKQHYNEFEVVRMRKKEIEAELRALEQDEQKDAASNSASGNTISPRLSSDSIKPILVHHHPVDSPSSSHHHHVHVEADDQHDSDQTLTPEERERKRQFELKRKKHYNEFRAARLADKDDKDETTG